MAKPCLLFTRLALSIGLISIFFIKFSSARAAPYVSSQFSHMHGHTPAHSLSKLRPRDNDTTQVPSISFTPDYVLHATAEIVNLSCVPRMSVVFNGMVPGPLLKFTEGQTKWVRVYNRIKANQDIHHEGLMVHWHGLDIKPQMDGTPVTQMPIMPGYFFDYEITPPPGSAGTYLYHEHAGGFGAVSLGGPLLVYEADLKTRPWKYDEERVVYISETYPRSDADIESGLVAIPEVWSGEPSSILLNGKGYTPGKGSLFGNCTIETFKLTPGKKHRFRFISGATLSYLYFGLQGHDMEIIEADGENTHPLSTKFLHINTGQRYSVLITGKSSDELATDRDKGIKFYWLEGHTTERPVQTEDVFAAVYYDKVDTPLQAMPQMNVAQANQDPKNPTYKSSVWGFEYPAYNREDYLLQPIDKYTDMPSYQDVKYSVVINTHQEVAATITWQQNGRTWFGPRDDIPTLIALIDGENLQEYTPLAVDDNHFDTNQANNQYFVNTGDVIEIVIQNIATQDQGDAGNIAADAHPWHLHGAHYYDMGHGPGAYDAKANEQLIKDGKRIPIKRDTSVLYRYLDAEKVGAPDGWRTFRIKVTSVGAWMLHCHIIQHMIMGMNTAWVFGDAKDIRALPSPHVQGWNLLSPRNVIADTDSLSSPFSTVPVGIPFREIS